MIFSSIDFIGNALFISRRFIEIPEKVQSFQDCKSYITAHGPAFHAGLMLFIASGDIDRAIRINLTYNFFVQPIISLIFSRSIFSSQLYIFADAHTFIIAFPRLLFV